MKKVLALKIDVDTYRGMKIGVPNLIALLDRHKVKGSFFLTFGPDHSGKAVWNIFRKRGFLKKMFRTGAPRLYGFKTILYGTILPGPLIASSFPETVRLLKNKGHEVAVHAWNHRLWQDHLDEMSEEDIHKEFNKAFQAYEHILGCHPRAVGAPAWYGSEISLKVEDDLNLDYASDTRYGPPFLPELNGRVFKTLQIPSSLPCIEELIGLGRKRRKDLACFILSLLEQDGFNVLPVHAEVEGISFLSVFDDLLRYSLEEGFRIVPLTKIAELVQKAGLPILPVGFRKVPGRAGKVLMPTENRREPNFPLIQRARHFRWYQVALIQRIGNALQYYPLKGLLCLLGQVRPSLLRKLCLFIGEAARLFDRKHVSIARENLVRALPEASLERRQEILRGMFRHFGLMIQDAILMQKHVNSENWQSILEMSAQGQMDKLSAEGRGCILVTGHLGDWEIGGALLAFRFKMNSVSRYYRNPLIQREIEQFRRAFGQKITYVHEGLGAMLAALKRGEFLALLSDKHLNSNQVPVEFFGSHVKAPSGPAVLSLRTGAPILPIAVIRINEAFRFRIDCGDVIRPDPKAGFHHELRRITQAYTSFFERFIRKYPEQWIWFHKRWKKTVDSNEKRIAAYHPACTKRAWRKRVKGDHAFT